MTVRRRGISPKDKGGTRQVLRRVLVDEQALEQLRGLLQDTIGNSGDAVRAYADGEPLEEWATSSPPGRLSVCGPGIEVVLSEREAYVHGKRDLCRVAYDWAIRHRTRRRTKEEKKHARFHVYQAIAMFALVGAIGLVVTASRGDAISWPSPVWAGALVVLPVLVYFTPVSRKKSVAVVRWGVGTAP